MKVVRKIIALFLFFAISNIVVAKSVHELFFHQKIEICTAKTNKHIHPKQFTDNDFICDFHFSTTVLTLQTHLSHQIFACFKPHINISYTHLLVAYYLKTLSSRAPPFLLN